MSLKQFVVLLVALVDSRELADRVVPKLYAFLVVLRRGLRQVIVQEVVDQLEDHHCGLVTRDDAQE